ncbi:MAG: DNA polymerase/3'-5' exonuclease PolX [Candidatus Rokubacteria bacterium]|nr:DNA polymerase/3'-5' exonuclease PolX [Candidatus Rokubacteria bacterium]
MKNAEIAGLFGEIAQLLEIKGENVFRVRAYERAVQSLESLAEDVARVAARGELSSIPGIGKGLAAHIAEYLATGRIAELEALRAELPRGLLEVLAVRGVGPRTARLLHEQLGVDSVEKLEQAAVSGEILRVPGIRAKTRANILAGLRTLRAGQERLPLGLALARAEEIVEALRGTGEVTAIEVAGSARRRRDTVGDLDILVACRHPERVIERFVGLSAVTTVLARGETKASVEFKADDRAASIHVDLRVIAPDTYGAALQYFTGSKDHNVRLRELAQRKGLKISEYGVFSERTGARVAGATEAEVYAAVGLPWIPPELRENSGEIEAALGGGLPDLVAAEHIRGDLHAHTDWSDGRQPLERLVAEAEARGYEYIIVSDHSRSSTVAGGLRPEELREQLRRIRALQPRHRIRILAGSECDILADGRMDFPDDLLAELDVVLAAVHSRFKQPRAEMTARIVRALAHPCVDILVHPTGRLLGERDPYDVDLEQVFAAAREHDKAMEINASWQRLDLKDTHARRAAELGVRIAISTDTHDLSQLEGLALGIATARRAWITPAQVVNALPVKRLLAWARGHRR